jgi:hypothetical protein
VNANAPLTGVGTSTTPLGLAIDATTLSVNASNQLTANKDSAIWNANKLCGTNLNCTTLSGLGVSDSGKVLAWNGSAWTAQSVPGDNWGSQVVQVNAPLTGNGTSGNPLGLAIDATTLSVNASDQLTANNTVRFGMRTSCAGLGWIARRLVGLWPSNSGKVLTWNGSAVDGAGGVWGQLGDAGGAGECAVDGGWDEHESAGVGY